MSAEVEAKYGLDIDDWVSPQQRLLQQEQERLRWAKHMENAYRLPPAIHTCIDQSKLAPCKGCGELINKSQSWCSISCQEAEDGPIYDDDDNYNDYEI